MPDPSGPLPGSAAARTATRRAAAQGTPRVPSTPGTRLGAPAPERGRTLGGLHPRALRDAGGGEERFEPWLAAFLDRADPTR